MNYRLSRTRWQWIILLCAAVVVLALASACSSEPVATSVEEETMSQDLTIWLTPEGEPAYKGAYDATRRCGPCHMKMCTCRPATA